MRIFTTTLWYELLLAYRHAVELLNPLWFFGIVSCMFPLAMSSDLQQLRLLAPCIIWVSALLAALLSLEHLFQSDANEGVLEQRILSVHPLALWVMAKVLAHWLSTGLPLLVLSGLLGLLLHLSPSTITILLSSLVLGTPVLYLLGAITAALTVRLRHGGMLLLLLTLPLYVPVLIFGANAVSLADAGMDVSGQLALLASLLFLSICLAPVATAAVLRVIVE